MPCAWHGNDVDSRLGTMSRLMCRAESEESVTKKFGGLYTGMRLLGSTTLALTLALIAGDCSAGPRRHDPLSADSLQAVPLRRFDFESESRPDPSQVAEELSGLAWLGGDRYMAIGDAHAVLHTLTIQVDPATGYIQSARVDSALTLRDEMGSPIPEPAMAEDREALMVDTARGEVWIADEHTGADQTRPSLVLHRLSDGRTLKTLRCDSDSMLLVFENARPNRGFESLTRSPDGSVVWTANEDALTVDGPASGAQAGGVVRLQKFDPEMRPVAQVAYRLDPYSAPVRKPLILSGHEISGLSELVALSNTRLLALERSFGGDIGGMASLRNRLYLVDVAGATDVSRGELRPGLAGKKFVPARKVLLWQEYWGLSNSNFEGMALGPELKDGSRLLVLVADNNAGTAQSLFTLRLRAR